MKKLVIILVIALLGTAPIVGAQPKAVKDAFEKKFATATKVKWGKEAPKEWEAEFTLEGEKISANFAQDGTWLETERKIKAADLPKNVAAALKTKYPDWKIVEADKTETSKHGTIYEADLKNGGKKKSTAFKEDGTPVKE